jgi:hypothetical protein
MLWQELLTMTDDAEFRLIMDDSDAVNKFNALKAHAESIAEEEVKLRRQVARTAQHAASLAMSVIGFMQNVFSIVGVQLDALQQAVLMSIQQVIATAVAWFTLQTAMLANPLTAVIGAIGMVAAAASLGVAIGQAALIAIYGDRVDASMTQIHAAIGNLQGIATGIVNLSGDF